MLKVAISVIFLALSLCSLCKAGSANTFQKKERVTFYSDTEEHPYFEFRNINDYKEFDKLKIAGRNMFSSRTIEIKKGISEDPSAIEVTFQSKRTDHTDPVFIQDGKDFYFFFQYEIGGRPFIEVMKQKGGSGSFDSIGKFSIYPNYANEIFIVKDGKIYFRYNEADSDGDDTHFMELDLASMEKEELFVAKGKTQFQKTIIDFKDKILFVAEYGVYEHDPRTRNLKTLIEFHTPGSPNDLRIYENQFYFSYQIDAKRIDFVYDGNIVTESKIPFSSGHLVGNRIYRDGLELSYFDIEQLIEVPIKFNCTQLPFAKKCVILNTEDPKRIVFGVSHSNSKEGGNRLYYTDGTNIEEIYTAIVPYANLTTSHIGPMTINNDYLFVGVTESSIKPAELTTDYLYIIHIPSKQAADVVCVCNPYVTQYLTLPCKNDFPLFSSDNNIYFVSSIDNDRHREDLFMYRFFLSTPNALYG